MDVEVTTGELNEGQHIVEQVDRTAARTGAKIKTVTADAGYAYGKVYGALEEREINAVIPAKAEPIRSAVPSRRFRYDAKNDILKCPRGKILRPQRPTKHGRFFYSKAKDCRRCSLASLCLSLGRWNKAIVISDHHPALDLPPKSGELAAHFAACLSNMAGLTKSSAEWRRTGL